MSHPLITHGLAFLGGAATVTLLACVLEWLRAVRMVRRCERAAQAASEQ